MKTNQQKLQIKNSKFDYILQLKKENSLRENDWSNLKTLAHDKDPEVRLYVSELLAFFNNMRSEQLLISLLDDPDHLVRASVCDSLAFSHSIDVLNRLSITASKDRRYLVRGYAILSIGDIQYNNGFDPQHVILLLKKIEIKETCAWVKIAIFRSLFLLGEYQYGDFLLNMIHNRYYKNRCFVLSLLEEIRQMGLLSKLPKIQCELQSQLKIESANSVKIKLQELLLKINRQSGDGSLINQGTVNQGTVP